jgi:hypothetical protein
MISVEIGNVTLFIVYVLNNDLFGLYNKLRKVGSENVG